MNMNLKRLSDKVIKRLSKPVIKRPLPLRIWHTRPDYAKLAKANYKKIWTEAELKNIIEYSKVYGH